MVFWDGREKSATKKGPKDNNLKEEHSAPTQYYNNLSVFPQKLYPFPV